MTRRTQRWRVPAQGPRPKGVRLPPGRGRPRHHCWHLRLARSESPLDPDGVPPAVGRRRAYSTNLSVSHRPRCSPFIRRFLENRSTCLESESYSSTHQTVSELFAIGAPSRPFVVPLFLTYDVLVIAFGLGVWGSAGRNRALRVVGGLEVAYGAVGLVGPFTPIHLRAGPGNGR
jgi:hypothetical protein